MRRFTPDAFIVSSPAAAIDPIALVQDDMRVVDRVIEARLSSEVPLVGQVAHYIIDSGGKRLRPVLLLLASGAIQAQHPHRHTLAAVVEFIHTATLLHDDVVDESTLRRGRSTANQIFGNAASVLVGDFLYSRAFQMMVDVDNMRVMQILSDATNVIAEGEVLQLMHMRNAELSEADYLHVIRSKTAKLFEASSRLAAVLQGADADTEQALATYGQALGTAFQIIDDVLDYEGDADELGKNLGDDLREGKTTLPIICALKHASASERERLQHAITSGDVAALPELIAIIQHGGGLAQAREVAAREAERALEAIADLPHNPHSEAMRALATGLLQRRH
jgi:octaprenyl-diphosphate synthase